MASASGFEAIFVSKLLFIRAICAIRGFNSGFRAESISAKPPAEKR
jgi:hypothetical protein